MPSHGNTVYAVIANNASQSVWKGIFFHNELAEQKQILGMCCK